MSADITIPDYLNESADDIHARMLLKAPSNIATIEGDIFWDTTRPAAEEKSKLEKIQMQNIMRMAFTQFSTGVYLEYLGECKNIYKNLPTKSFGAVQIIGTPGLTIIKGTLFGTVSSAEKESIKFKSLNNVTIDNTGMAIVELECLTAGTIGNVDSNTVTLLISNINGVKSITNNESIKGGTDIEDEEHYRQRVIMAEQQEKLSGADTDYISWALEIDGVGYAYAIEEWNGPGTVKVLILDKNSQPATEQLLQAVKNYIYPDKIPGQNRGGKAPVGAIVTISTPTTLTVDVEAKFIFTEGFSKEIILSALKVNINSYLKKITISGIINYNAIHTIIGSYILSSDGIEDFENLTVNNGITNIQLIDQVAVIGEVSDIS